MTHIAILRDATGTEQNRVQSDSIEALRGMVEAFLLPGMGPGDSIEFSDPQDDQTQAAYLQRAVSMTGKSPEEITGKT